VFKSKFNQLFKQLNNSCLTPWRFLAAELKETREETAAGFKALGNKVEGHEDRIRFLSWIIHKYCRALTGSFARNESLLGRP